MNRPITFRASKGFACPVCASGTKGCNATDDGLHFCRGVPLPGWFELTRDPDAAGFRHYREEGVQRPRKQLPSAPATPDDSAADSAADSVFPALVKTGKDWSEVAAKYAAGIRPDAKLELANALHLPVESLEVLPDLGVSERSLFGWTFTFPESDATGATIGISTRKPDRSKKMLSGSRRGLTLPDGWLERSGPIVCVEGPTDTLAMTQAGFACIGRPGNTAGTKLLAELLKDVPASRPIIIVGENDQKADGTWPGMDGRKIAVKLAKLLGRPVRWAMPPTGSKDVRDWLTDPARAYLSWRARGKDLLTHFNLRAETIGARPGVDAYDGLTPAEAAKIRVQAFTPLPVGPCPFTAVAEINDEMRLAGWWCENQTPVTLKDEYGPFVCDRPCGNGTLCRDCLMKRLHKKTRESNGYLVRTSAPQETQGGIESDPPRSVYAAVIDPTIAPGTKAWKTLVDAIRHRGGERDSILTEDLQGVALELGASEAGSRFFLSDNQVEEKSRSGLATLVRVSLPHTIDTDVVKVGGFVFRRVSAGTAIRAGWRAVQTVPQAPDDGSTFKPYHASKGWGDEEETQPTKVKGIGIAKINADQVESLCTKAGIRTREVAFDQANCASHGVGWVLPAGKSLAMLIWVCGKDAPWPPSADRIGDLVKHHLSNIPADIGDGWNVEQVLRSRIWHLDLYDFTAELQAADAKDKAYAQMECEAESIRRELKERYAGREHEASELIRLLLV